MKQSMSGGGGGGGCGSRGWRIPSEVEVEVVELLINFPKLVMKEQLLRKYKFTWGATKKRSVLVSKSESSPSTHRQINESRPEKVTAVEADKSPSTPLCFLPCGSGSDGAADKPKQQSSSKKSSKRKATNALKNALKEKYNHMQHEKEIIVRKIKTMENHREELRAQNRELKRRRLEINPRNADDLQLWNNPMKLNRDQQHYHQQITMFAPQPLQHYMLDPNNGKVVAMNCSSNSNSAGRFGFFNQIDTRVKSHHGETFDFMGTSQPLDHSQYLPVDNDQRARKAAEARKLRVMKMKENRNSSSVMKVSRACR